jgi:hypothetical protein
MTRLIQFAAAAAFSFALAAPASALPTSGRDIPSCGGDKDEKKDDKKNPSIAQPNCGGDKDEKKDDKKNPSIAQPSCGGDKDEKKDDKKNPSLF